MTVVVQFVGAGDAFGSGGRFQSCLSVRWASTHVLIDCGATSLVGLKRLGLDPSTVDCVLISHLHGDHFGGLPFLILDQQFARRERRLVVAGPAGTSSRLRQAMEVLFPGSTDVPGRFPLSVVELVPRERTQLGNVRATGFVVDHPSGDPSLALRVTCGNTHIAYSGDTAWTDALVEAAHGTDLFVCEAYTFEKRLKYHLDYATLRANRARLEARRLVLTHLGPDALAHRDEILDAEVADDGLEIAL